MLRAHGRTHSNATLVAVLAVAAGCSDGSSGEMSVGGHAARALSSAEIGDSSRGERLFVTKRCADCHAYDGEGGEDASALDFMRGKLTAADIANMSGTIWNHMPQMVIYFQQEGIEVPTFSDDEMADLIAYLHAGPAE